MHALIHYSVQHMSRSRSMAFACCAKKTESKVLTLEHFRPYHIICG